APQHPAVVFDEIADATDPLQGRRGSGPPEPGEFVMSHKRLTTYRLTAAAHKAFGKLSGDVNPIHFDDKYARRAFAGEPVAHGVNLLLLALDAYFKATRGSTGPFTLSARLMKPAFLN